jgi:hypothetical protein
MSPTQTPPNCGAFASTPGCTAERDSPLEGDGFELPVPRQTSTPDGIWLGTYEDGPGRLFHFTAVTLARLSDGETLEASQAATVLTIPDHAHGAAIGGGGLWIARSDWSWGTLDRLDPVTGAPQRRYEIAPGTEGIAFGYAGRLWAVSEAGSRHIYDHPFLDLFEPFFRLVFALDLSRLE